MIQSNNETSSRAGRWRMWEIGCLIDGCGEGRPFAAIAAAIDRTPAACQRMWQRLIDGSADCPTMLEASLEKARANTIRPMKKTPRRAEVEQLTEQYKALMREVQVNSARLAELHRMIALQLAMELTIGTINRDELLHLLGQTEALAVIRAADHLQQYRKRAAGLAEPPEGS